jgi:hypothetical protein
VVEANGQLLIFLPPYSPNFNLIKESFSCGMHRSICSKYTKSKYPTVKAWIHCNWSHIQDAEYPKLVLMEAAHVVTPAKRGSGLCKGNLTVLRKILYLDLAKGNQK